MAPYRDEHMLIIAPGSRTTHVQLGLPESLAPAQHKFATRMFLAPDGKSYEPYRIKSSKKEDSDEEELIEYPEDDEGAIWPLKDGRIDDLKCFLAFLHHIHGKLQPGLHIGLVIVAQPCWTPKDHEEITRFVFETFKVPGFLLLDSAIATTWAYGVENALVLDVGYTKADISAVSQFAVANRGTTIGFGGDNMTETLLSLVKGKYEPPFTKEMAEKLKQSNICEVLPPNMPLPGSEGFEEDISNPAAAASTGALASGPSVKITGPPRMNTEPGLDDVVEKEDGVLDIATIVASGKTQEFLAKAEKAKADKAAAKKAVKDREAAEAAATRATRIPNSKRLHNTWVWESVKSDGQKEKEREKEKTPEPVTAIDSAGPVQAAEDSSLPATEAAGQSKPTAKKDKKKQWEDDNPDLVRHEYQIGPERLMVADHWFIDRIADEIYRCVQGMRDMSSRQNVWDNIIICGGGAKVKGFKEAVMQTLNNRYLISPSSATMFMSELPSNIATPSGTGSMTPNASFTPTPHGGPTQSNSLLIAATTASNPALNPNLQSGYNPGYNTHSSHSQTPTAIKLASPPTYMPEYKDFHDADFLGACVAAKTVLVTDGGATKGLFVTRNMFNEEGPSAIHQM
ncbi:Actin-like ATPase [Glarea lozoyensis ATCC 20868]|uniref:Actin-like ATPase n=1 Tax=Glarea lozoyensis (strain ATCC 20868 / MF5171) TaxID=1116229 RepID=S3CDM3_GLAL2|nr:Actin-like ATPase [Glarea lozoyensis ATCC 20868]EPE24622.1 Actin-like ATPase [Glarea lozoyensis ATCC 20868]